MKTLLTYKTGIKKFFLSLNGIILFADGRGFIDSRYITIRNGGIDDAIRYVFYQYKANEIIPMPYKLWLVDDNGNLRNHLPEHLCSRNKIVMVAWNDIPDEPFLLLGKEEYYQQDEWLAYPINKKSDNRLVYRINQDQIVKIVDEL